jgi:hypothetical protein
MLGHLAGPLRALSHDVLWEPFPGPSFLDRVAHERRTLVTLRRRLPAGFASPVVRLTANRPDDQLAELGRRLPLAVPEDRLLLRCLLCNEVTEELPPEEAANRVPRGVGERFEAFRRCPRCGRIYWWGSHADRIAERLRRLGLAKPSGREEGSPEERR